MIAAFSRTTDLAIAILPFILEVFRLFGGKSIARLWLTRRLLQTAGDPS